MRERPRHTLLAWLTIGLPAIASAGGLLTIQAALRHEDSFSHFYAGLAVALAAAAIFFHWSRLYDRLAIENLTLKSMITMLSAQSMTDDVTGLYNHRHLMEEIEKEVERSKRHHHALSAMMIDLDNFKQINEHYGHPTGDCVLREIAWILSQSIRKIDIIGRYGGDEFIVILPEARSGDARPVADRIVRNVSQHRFKTKRDYMNLTCSVGLFSFDDAKDLDKEAFVDRIDEALFKAKSLGKDRVFVLDLECRHAPAA